MNTHSRVVAVVVLVAALAAAAGAASAASTFTQASSIPPAPGRIAAPQAEKIFTVDLQALRAELQAAPLARSGDGGLAPVIDLPLPDGTTQEFHVWNSPVMAPELAARYPEIQTYEVYGISDRSAFGRMSVTPLGLHVLISRAQGSVWIDPYTQGDQTHVSVYRGIDAGRSQPIEYPGCATPEDLDFTRELHQLMEQDQQRGGLTTGDELRTYRLANAATGEYTAFHGGTVPLGLAAVVVAVNRVDEVYQREFCVFLELVPNNDLIIYTNSATDPYTNNNGATMLTQNQTNLDAVIGNANYDIGHVFSTGGGGIAGLGVVCRTGFKARGVTGLTSPIGDNFYIDFVAHEMGHQFGANHCFNSQTGNCGGGNRNGSTAYEPGSGTTIMAYAGICGTDNIQMHSDDYMHNVSFNEIRTYIESGFGANCPVVTLTGNTPPTADANIGVFTIPISTPFEFTGSGGDVDTDPITYCWEEWDLGPAGAWNAPSGNAPIFRSFDPVSTPTRTFPRISDIVNNTTTRGEILPSYTRSLNFRLTVRDMLGGVAYSQTSAISVVSTAGPFTVTYPTNAGVAWTGGANETVTWNVASTNVAPVNCALVDIYLSDDGGYTYPYLLAANEANDGSASIVVPALNTTTARVKVAAADNIFFDISNNNLSITTTIDVDQPIAVRGDRMLIGSEPNPFSGITHVRFRLDQDAPVSLKVYSASGREVATLAEGVYRAGVYARSWNGNDYDERQTPSGVYFCRLEAAGRVETQQIVRTR